MAECEKKEEECTFKEQSASLPPCVDTGSSEDYIHNPEEFIDIHGDHRKQRTCCVDRGDLQGSESPNVPDMKTDVNMLVANEESEFKHPSPGSHVLENLKVPVQVSEESDVQDTLETKQGTNNDDSDEEYQSADEGNGDGDKAGYTEEGDSEDDFILVGDEDNYGGDGDHNRGFPKKENVTVNEEDDNNEEEEQVTKSDTQDETEIRKKFEETLTEEERQVSEKS